jgi:hypothetical protein
VSYKYKQPMRTQKIGQYILDIFPLFEDQYASKEVFNSSIITSCFNCIYEYDGHGPSNSDWDSVLETETRTETFRTRAAGMRAAGGMRTAGSYGVRTIRTTWNSSRLKPNPTDYTSSGNVFSIVKLKSSSQSDRYMFAYDSMAFTDKKCVIHLLKLLFYGI